jgi:hypothetical protein
LRNAPRTDTACNLNDSSDSSDSSAVDTSIPGSQKCKRKSKSQIAYKKLAFKKRRAADRQSAKCDIAVEVRPSIRERHTASSTPINVPSFSLDAKTPAKTGYVGIRDSNASKRVYALKEMVGVGSKFNFNLVEWDGKYCVHHCLYSLYSHLRDAGHHAQLLIKHSALLRHFAATQMIPTGNQFTSRQLTPCGEQSVAYAAPRRTQSTDGGTSPPLPLGSPLEEARRFSVLPQTSCLPLT